MAKALNACEILSTRTRLAHRQTEQAPQLQRLATGELDAKSYCEAIVGFTALFDDVLGSIQTTPCGPAILAQSSGLIQLQLLQNDLEALGVAPCCRQDWNGLGHTDSAWGALYVLEGARLGATIICHRLRQHGHKTEAPGYGFFHHATANAKHDFSRFCAGANQALATPDAHERAVAGALAAFDVAQRRFGARPHV